ncbi:MAG: TetR/AcrR family transcriptional regulator [Burkholderiales bacterium]|jgi:AcrR family transcriptional regulator|nr:TetR/AcrR family transcriptional regulator [Burkholderiales bacterium]
MPDSVEPSRKPYVSALRTAAADAKRGRVIAAATQSLREEGGLGGFSLDSVAKAAGVTRLTVYNQFGSRRGLLEAVFDDIAARGRLATIPEALSLADPLQGLDAIIERFCAFWSSDEAIGRLHDAMASDAEFAIALTQRNERRRKLLQALMKRLLPADVPARRRRDAIDFVYAMTSYAMFRLLGSNRSVDAVAELVKTSCRAVLDDAAATRSG